MGRKLTYYGTKKGILLRILMLKGKLTDCDVKSVGVTDQAVYKLRNEGWGNIHRVINGKEGWWEFIPEHMIDKKWKTFRSFNRGLVPDNSQSTLKDKVWKR